MNSCNENINNKDKIDKNKQVGLGDSPSFREHLPCVNEDTCLDASPDVPLSDSGDQTLMRLSKLGYEAITREACCANDLPSLQGKMSSL